MVAYRFNSKHVYKMKILGIKESLVETTPQSYDFKPQPIKWFYVDFENDEGEPEMMVVFATEEITAISKAIEAYETNKKVITLQKITEAKK